jgi:hypothetical protein
MKQQTIDIEAGNRLIAEFEGWEAGRFQNLPNRVHKEQDGKLLGISVSELKYRASWDWLMPVFAKINDMIKNEEIAHDYQSSALHDFIEIAILEVNITAAHNYLVQFITWYKTQQP